MLGYGRQAILYICWVDLGSPRRVILPSILLFSIRFPWVCVTLQLHFYWKFLTRRTLVLVRTLFSIANGAEASHFFCFYKW